MEDKLLSKFFLYISVASVVFISLYSLFIDYKFSNDLLNYLFTLLYLILSLNFIVGTSDSANKKERLTRIFKSRESILLYCIMAGSFSVIFIRSGFGIFKTTLIILSSLALFDFSMYILNRRTTLIFFWINFYLFAGMTALSHLPHANIDLVSRYNPFGGLLITIIM